MGGDLAWGPLFNGDDEQVENTHWRKAKQMQSVWSWVWEDTKPEALLLNVEQNDQEKFEEEEE